MPGTYIQDASAINLASGSTLNAAGSTNGTVAESPWSGEIAIRLVTPNEITGTNPTLLVTIQASDVVGFGSGVVTLGQFPVTSGTADSQENVTRYIQAYHDKRYLRATVTLGGTNPVYTGLTITPVPKHEMRSATTTA